MTNKTNWLSWRMWGFTLLVWSGYALMQMLVMLSLSDAWSPDPVASAALSMAWHVVPFVVATPLLFHLCQSVTGRDLPRRRYWRALAAVVVGASALHAIVNLVCFDTDARFVVGNFLSSMVAFWFVYGAIVAIACAVTQRQLADVRQGELLDAQLRALRAQLQPHFLFNTLHAISVTGRTDAAAATRMITLLGDLLRLTLRERSGEFVSLAEEQELLQPYLELQKLRFPDRLRIEIDFPEDVLGGAVPDLLLQPLVENALKHGLEQRPEGGTVSIAARRWGDRLEIQVRDDGAGLAPAGGAVQLGVGLGTTKARLQALFGKAAWVTLMPAPGGGAVTTVTLPWREVARAA